MKITVTYILSGKSTMLSKANVKKFSRDIIIGITGPLKTGLNAANYQLASEGKRVALKLLKIEGGSDAAE